MARPLAQFNIVNSAIVRAHLAASSADGPCYIVATVGGVPVGSHFVPTAIFEVCLATELCQRPRQNAVGIDYGRRPLIWLP
jgi:hypothetical protein